MKTPHKHAEVLRAIAVIREGQRAAIAKVEGAKV
jgi:hypothetical protein